jgi:hypothetical protein
LDSISRTPHQRVFVTDAHRGDGKRFVVRADEKLSAFLELESAIRFPAERVERSNQCGSILGF